MENRLYTARKEENISRVVTHALICFVDKGIDAAKVSDIAKMAGLTERSVFRYFESKSDLVLETALLFWRKVMEQATLVCRDRQAGKLGADRIYAVLLAYAEILFTSRQELVFVHEAEAYLKRNGKSSLVKGKPPAPFKDRKGPLAEAIYMGIEDGSVRADDDIENLYYNTYDSLLGLMQKMAIDEERDTEENMRRRVTGFCKILADAYRSKS